MGVYPSRSTQELAALTVAPELPGGAFTPSTGIILPSVAWHATACKYDDGGNEQVCEREGATPFLTLRPWSRSIPEASRIGLSLLIALDALEANGQRLYPAHLVVRVFKLNLHVCT